jgi:hypothetical protein
MVGRERFERSTIRLKDLPKTAKTRLNRSIKAFKKQF